MTLTEAWQLSDLLNSVLAKLTEVGPSVSQLDALEDQIKAAEGRLAEVEGKIRERRETADREFERHPIFTMGEAFKTLQNALDAAGSIFAQLNLDIERKKVEIAETQAAYTAAYEKHQAFLVEVKAFKDQLTG